MIFEFKFPDVGEGVHEGKVMKLNFQPGKDVVEGDILAVVETDKVVAEIPSSQTGKLQKYGVAEGQIINVGETLAFIEIEGDIQTKTDEEEVGSVVGTIEGPKDGAILPASGEGITDSDPEALSLVPGEIRILATPLARKIAADLKIDLTLVKGTGPGGRLLKQDILNFSQSQPVIHDEPATRPKPVSTPQPLPKVNPKSKTSKIIEFSQLRKTIAKNMEISHQIPAFVMHDYAVIDKLVNYRNNFNENKEKIDRVSFIPFIIKALAAALKKYPYMNGEYISDKYEVHLYKDINIGIAADTDEGLIVPVLKNVPSKSILELNLELKSLAGRAKARTISLDETRGGTISITNYGSFGGTYGRPMIMPPQLAILGLGRIEKQAVVINDEIKAANILPLSLVADHRAVDGAPAGKFLSYFLNLLQNFDELLLHL